VAVARRPHARARRKEGSSTRQSATRWERVWCSCLLRGSDLGTRPIARAPAHNWYKEADARRSSMRSRRGPRRGGSYRLRSRPASRPQIRCAKRVPPSAHTREREILGSRRTARSARQSPASCIETRDGEDSPPEPVREARRVDAPAAVAAAMRRALSSKPTKSSGLNGGRGMRLRGAAPKRLG